MRILRAAEGRRTPWKNGGGETVEIAVHPPGAGFDAFDWRVSTALVSADGPFSAFSGVDRTLAVLTGAGLELAVGGDAPLRLTPASAPFSFPADAPCAGRLVGGPVTDLNVMTRRGRFTHAVRPLDLAGPATLDAEGGTALVFCREGRISAGGDVLGAGDAVLFEGALEIAAPGDGAEGLVVTVRPSPSRSRLTRRPAH